MTKSSFMKGLNNPSYQVLYFIANIVALVLVWAAWKKPRLARLLYLILFIWSCSVNWYTVSHTPEVYKEYADLSLIHFYSQFISGWFARHIVLMVGTIATCQGLIAASMLFKGWIYITGLTGGIIFLLAIAPFGVGSGFPATLIMAFGMFLLLRHSRHQDYLWMQQNTSAA